MTRRIRAGGRKMARMAKKRGRKVRVDFKSNRATPRRDTDWTARFQRDHDATLDAASSESVRAKGDLSRKRTIVVGDDETPLVDQSLWSVGVVTIVHGRECTVVADAGGDWECTVRGVLRTRAIDKRSPIAVGDRVWISDQARLHGGRRIGVIERVEPRRSVLARKEFRGRGHVLVANADQLIIIASVRQPAIKPHLIDRYLVAAARGDMRPLVCFQKWDLLADADSARPGGGAVEPPDEAEPDAEGDDDVEFITTEEWIEELLAEYEALGYRCLRLSAATGLGMETLREALRGHVSVFSGQSGVGKSSLINALQPGLKLTVGDVSRDNEKGRHTTTRARLLPLESGGFVVDTPGIRQFDLWSVPPGELEACFVEFLPLIARCRFKDCHHCDEEGCAVREAMYAGALSERRYASYRKMLAELSRTQR